MILWSHGLWLYFRKTRISHVSSDLEGTTLGRTLSQPSLCPCFVPDMSVSHVWHQFCKPGGYDSLDKDSWDPATCEQATSTSQAGLFWLPLCDMTALLPRPVARSQDISHPPSSRSMWQGFTFQGFPPSAYLKPMAFICMSICKYGIKLYLT